MISEKYADMTTKGSIIREFAQYASKRAAEIGKENVYNFTIGNPSVPVCPEFTETLERMLKEENPLTLHGYSPTLGIMSVREAVADSLNRRFGMEYTADDIFMTSGAAGAIAHAIRCVTKPGDEVITFAPYFPEYVPYVDGTGAVLKIVPADITSFQINFDAFLELLNPNVQAVLINSPNNPSGIVYSTETIKKLAAILEEKQKEYGHDIYIISDEPYREIVFEGTDSPFISSFYDNSICCYSFSKSLSLPGERIGYVVVPDEVENADQVIDGIVVSNRTLGFVNAPSLLQKAVAKCLDEKTNLVFYDENRKMLYEGLQKLGFHCIKPEGAFYMWVKSPDTDEEKFVAAGKKYNIIMVKGSAFGCAGYVRLAYCVSHETVKNALTAFEKLAEDYGLYTE